MATLKVRLEALATGIGNYIRDSVLPRLVPTGGTTGHVLTKLASGFGWQAAAADPWTILKLGADYTNATVTFANVNDGTVTLTFTPPANTDWEMEARLILVTTTATNLPRVGVNVGGNLANGYGGINIWQGGATSSTAVQATGGFWNSASAVNVQMAAGGLPAANVAGLAEVIASGRSGSSPQPITIQMAAETAGANICYVKRGSFLRWRTV